MANITVYEFSAAPNATGDVTWPADVVTTTATGSTVSLGSTTRAFVICADADCHVSINGSGQSAAGSAYTLPILSAVPNQFLIAPAASQTVKFA